MYFFSWNCTWFGQKESIKVQNFRLSTAHMKCHQICTFIGSFHWNYIKFQLKKDRGVMSHDTCHVESYVSLQRTYVYGHWRMIKNLKRNWLVVSKLTWRLWRILTRALESRKNLHFNGLFRTNVYNVSPKKAQRSYLSWHWRVMQNLKKN